MGSVLRTSVYTSRMGRLGTEPFAASLDLHRLISSITLESMPRCVVSRTAPLRGDRHRLKSSSSITDGTKRGFLALARATSERKVESYTPNFARTPALVSNSQPLVRCWWLTLLTMILSIQSLNGILEWV